MVAVAGCNPLNARLGFGVPVIKNMVGKATVSLCRDERVCPVQLMPQRWPRKKSSRWKPTDALWEAVWPSGMTLAQMLCLSVTSTRTLRLSDLAPFRMT